MTKTNPVVANTSIIISMAVLLGLSQTTHAQSTNATIGFADVGICTPGIIERPSSLLHASSGPDDEQPTDIEGDEIQTEDGNQIMIIGNAQIVQGRRGMFADKIEFNKDTYQAGAKGNVKFYTGNGDEISAESLEMEADTFIGTAENAEIRLADHSPYFTKRKHYRFTENYSIFAPFRNKVIVLEDDQAAADENIYVKTRAKAKNIEFEGKDFQILNNTTLTTCVEGDDSVLLSARKIELDHVAGTGSAKNMTVKFKNIPIFYFPTITFPINDERKTGFLFPGIGYEDESGTIIEAPYYINIGPQHDATITPRILSKRGFQIYGEFRYLTEKSRGEIEAEYLPGDDVFGDDRHAISFYNETKFDHGWEADIDFQDVSDVSYFNDFSSDVDASSVTFIPQNASLNYFGDKIRFSATASVYNRVNKDVSITSQPYERLPEINFNLKPQKLGLFSFGIESELTNYSNENSDLVDGSRLRIKPSLSLPLDEIYGYVKPKISFQSISYSLNNNPTANDSPSEVIPIASIDSGLIFERLIKRPETTYLQTLEPRLFYVNIPERPGQEAFPDFDTGEGSTSSFSHFFKENRYFGGDRVGDTNQLSVGLTSRIINDDTGREKFKLSLGQVFFFKDREAGLTTDSAPDTQSRSDFLAEVSTSISEDWSIRGFARWNEEDNDLEHISFSADYYHSTRRNGSISYSHVDQSSEQLNLRIETPLAQRWQFDGRVDYSIEESELRSGQLGVVYDGCCWAIGLAAQRYRSSSEFKNRLVVTFELDDLGRISSG